MGNTLVLQPDLSGNPFCFFKKTKRLGAEGGKAAPIKKAA